MKCPNCETEMQAGAVRVGTSMTSWWIELLGDLISWRIDLFGALQGGFRSPRSLYFASTDESKEDIVLQEEVSRPANRCLRCHAIVLLDRPPPPLEWIVRIAKQQQTKAPRRAVYDCLRKHRIPHPVASQKARLFHAGVQVEIPFPERARAETMMDQVRSLGLVAEVIEPVIEKQREPTPSAQSN